MKLFDFYNNLKADKIVKVKKDRWKVAASEFRSTKGSLDVSSSSPIVGFSYVVSSQATKAMVASCIHFLPLK